MSNLKWNLLGSWIAMAFFISLISAILNYTYNWADWYYVVNSFWELYGAVAGFYCYKGTRFQSKGWDMIFYSLISFSAINLAHSAVSIIFSMLSDKTLNDALKIYFEEYVLVFNVFASIPGCFGVIEIIKKYYGPK